MKAAILWFIGSLASLSTCSLTCYLGERLDLWWRCYDSFALFPFMALSMIALCAAGLATLFFTPFCLAVSVQSAYNALKQSESAVSSLEVGDGIVFWLRDNCRDSQELSGATQLFENYSNWCFASGIHPISLTAFGKALTTRLGYEKVRTRDGIFYRIDIKQG